MAKIVIEIPDELIEKALDNNKYLFNGNEKSYVDLTMMYTNGELTSVFVDSVDFYRCKYSVLPKGYGDLEDAQTIIEADKEG